MNAPGLVDPYKQEKNGKCGQVELPWVIKKKKVGDTSLVSMCRVQEVSMHE